MEINVTNIATVYEITFVDGDNTVTVTAGEGWAAVAPEVNVPEGKRFLRWSLEPNGTEAVNINSVTADMTLYAVYSDALTINFVSNNETLGTVDASVPSAVGGSIEYLPAYAPTEIGKFMWWTDEAGNKYTDDELLALTFTEAATFTAVFAGTKIELNKTYDFTSMTDDELAMSPFEIKYETELTSDGLLIPNNQTIFAYLPEEYMTGVYELAITYINTAETDGGFDSYFYGSTVNYNDRIQGLFITGDKIYTGNEAENMQPAACSNIFTSPNVEHTVKYIFDMDNRKFYVVLDGVAGVSITQKIMKEFGLGALTFGTKPGFVYKTFAINELNNFAVNTLTVDVSDAGSAVIGNRANQTSYTFPVDAKIQVNYTGDANGTVFNGWDVVGGSLEDATAKNTFFTFAGSEVATATANAEVRMLTLKFIENSAAPFTAETAQYADQTIAYATKPAGAPELQLPSGVEFGGWEETTTGWKTTTSTIVGNAMSGDLCFKPILSKTVGITASVDNGTVQKGQMVKVPVTITANEYVKSGTITVEYDTAVLDYVGSSIDTELLSSVYVREDAAGTLTVVVNAKDYVKFSDTILGTLNFKGISTVDGAGEIAVTASNLTFVSDYDMSDITVINDLTATAGSVDVSILMGDVDENGKINIYDAVAVLEYVAGTKTLSEAQLAAANVDATDAAVTLADATRIVKYVARVITSF